MVSELIIMAATVTPHELILEHLKEDINRYLINKSEENLAKVQMGCAILLTKRVVEEKGAMETIKDMEDFSSISKLLKPNKN